MAPAGNGGVGPPTEAIENAVEKVHRVDALQCLKLLTQETNMTDDQAPSPPSPTARSYRDVGPAGMANCSGCGQGGMHRRKFKTGDGQEETWHRECLVKAGAIIDDNTIVNPAQTKSAPKPKPYAVTAGPASNPGASEMRRDPESLLIKREEEAAARKRRPPLPGWPSSPRALAPRVRMPPPPHSLGREQASPPGTLTVAKLKVSTTLNPAELLAIPAPEGRTRVSLRVHLPDHRILTAEVASKALRRAQRAIREASVDSIVLLQGKLIGNAVAEAGLSLQSQGTSR